ncbi:LuxR C-terminal-related transcriptional regulator [Nonomuraea sp. NPDC050790]|uniref:LuxR C-terminal-related transcriptional regulator n=1 Tax=Nonomuraea sp. NPDC050790 TaxID=3364371 RepID=UPI0037A88CFE
MHGLIGEARYWAKRAFPATTACGEGLAMHALFTVMHNEVEAAGPLLDTAAALAASTGDEALKGYVALVYGVAGLFSGELAEARARLEEGSAIHARLGTRDVLVPLGPVFIAVVAALQGDFDGAVEQTAAVVAGGAQAGELWARSYAEAVWGMTLMLGGEPSAGLVRLREALRVKHDLDDMLGIALCLEFYGGCLVNLGTPEAAARLIGSVEDARTASGISMFGPQHTLIREIMEQQCRDALGEEVFDAQRRIGHRIGLEQTVAGILAESDPPAPAQSPEPLTKREYEIALLVSQGLTNRQIAERLGIAKRTVDTHMENILTKLGISSRVQIAAWIRGEAG